MRSFSTFIVARASMKARKVSLWACFSMTPRARSLCQRSTRQLQQSRKHSRVYYRPRFGSDGKGKRPVALTKAELAEALFEDLGLNKREAKEFVDLFFEEISGRLEAGQEEIGRATYREREGK